MSCIILFPGMSLYICCRSCAMRQRRINVPVVVFLLAGLVLHSCKKDNCKRKIHQKIYVANEGSGTITVLDAESYETLKTVDLTYKDKLHTPHNVQVAPDNQSVWITAAPQGHGDDYLVVLRGKRDKAKDWIKVGNHQHLAHVVLDEESKFAFATAYEANQVLQVDVETLKEVQRFALGSGTGPHGLRYLNGKLYVACMDSRELVTIDVVSGQLNRVYLGGMAVQTAVLPGLNSVFVSLYDLKQIVRYDISTGDTTVIQLPIGSQGPIQLYPSPDNQRVYVCDQGIVNGHPSSDKLYVINTWSNTVTASVTVGNGAHGVVVSKDGRKIFVTNTLDDTISVIDAQSLNLITTISVGDAPNGISYLECDCD